MLIHNEKEHIEEVKMQNIDLDLELTANSPETAAMVPAMMIQN